MRGVPPPRPLLRAKRADAVRNAAGEQLVVFFDGRAEDVRGHERKLADIGLVDRTGGPLRVIAEGALATDYALSPDKDRIAFTIPKGDFEGLYTRALR